MYFIFFFFKQKTAYDMRISDWSSDVCSSDLLGQGARPRRQTLQGDDCPPRPEQRRLLCLGPAPHRRLLCREQADEGVHRHREHRHQFAAVHVELRSEEHTSELQSLMRTLYAVICLQKKH